jgi:thymidylate synthase (FAD)
MRVIKPSFTLKFPRTKEVMNDMLLLVEEAARLCYKTEGKVGDVPNAKFIRDKVDRGHLSVVEHSLISVKVVCDRGVSHELVRHRIASYSQESTRYCNYSNDQFGNEITVIKPIFFETGTKVYKIWHNACSEIEKAYFELLSLGCTAQEARDILPNSLKTEIMISMNFREWRHFFKERTSQAAHPQMREISIPMLKQFKQIAPVMFNDIKYDEAFAEHYGL